MKRIMFVCHGNICRSPLAEFLFKDRLKDLGKENDFYVKSSATSSEELGNPIYPPMAKILDRLNIDYSKKRAEKLLKNDYEKYDYFIGMDDRNIVNMLKIFGGDNEKKIYKLLDFTCDSKDVSDPWWTGDFEGTFLDITRGIEGLLKFLKIN
ncbi:MAG: low molecular weight phosphotyrosine protein phosphatase [Clostridia bacterium]|nr:low molecular weight phosphotyrosine protein phosphatase [Clostridia bacterium]